MCIGLLYAMKGEIESLLTEETPLLQEKAGVLFYRIQEDIIACCGGVGKVNAAMATQLFIDLYHPDLILNVGVAGCFEDLPIGTLVLPDRFMQHDMDTSGIGDPVGLISTVNRMDFPTARQALAEGAELCDTMRETMSHLLRTADYTELEAALRAADGYLEQQATEDALGELRRAQVEVERLEWLARRLV